jgi:hypothetical protein
MIKTRDSREFQAYFRRHKPPLLAASASGSPESERKPRTRGATLPRAGIQSADDPYARGDKDVITTGSTPEHRRQ